MKTKTKNAPVSAKKSATRSMDSVMSILNWTTEQYCEYQFEQGLVFLDNYAGEAECFRDLLSQSRIYWNWWKNQWKLRDQYFISRLKNVERHWHPEVWYKISNSGEHLAKNIHPNSAVIDLSYAEMITEFVADEKQKA